MDEQDSFAQPAREPVLSRVDRVSEVLFGLFMALTFVGAISVAGSGRDEIRSTLAAALGCNIAWGLVDAVMYLVRTITNRGKAFTLARSVRAAADLAAGRQLVRASLPQIAAGLLGDTEIEAIRARIVALPSVPQRPSLQRDDLVAALAVFLLVVASTFPVALPYILFEDLGAATLVSRAVALTMLFLGGLALGRYAGYGSWKAGLMMVGLGTVLVAAVIALGG